MSTASGRESDILKGFCVVGLDCSFLSEASSLFEVDGSFIFSS